MRRNVVQAGGGNRRSYKKTEGGVSKLKKLLQGKIRGGGRERSSQGRTMPAWKRGNEVQKRKLICQEKGAESLLD